jgi:IS30 family transposase
MTRFSLTILLSSFLSGCTLPADDGIPRIRSQRDIAAYNASVSDPGQELVCTREVVVGTNFRPYVCLTVAQWQRREQDDQQYIDDVFSRVGTGAPPDPDL